MARKSRKKIIPNVRLTGIADRGKAVGRDEEGMVVFVEGGVPGDLMDVQTQRKKKGVWNGIPHHIHEYSEDRTEAFCKHFSECGGCKWQHLSYEAQIKHKNKVVLDAFSRLAKVEIDDIQGIVGAEKIRAYRNKMVYSFAGRKWIAQDIIDRGEEVDFRNGLGFYRAGAFDKVVDIQECHLQEGLTNKLRNWLRDYTLSHEISYHDPRSHKGFMRNLFVRNNRKGEWMVNIIFHSDDQKIIKPMLEEIHAAFPEIVSLWYTINPKMNDSTADLDRIHFAGDKYLQESLGDVNFNIGPKSFFQTNTYQAEKLYLTVLDFADFQGTENVYDLYTGLGSIALYIAKYCKHVVGIEEIEAAIDDAKMNQKLNDIDNATFYAGDVKNILDDAFADKHGKPDILITDPPRMGMHADVVDMLIKLETPKVIYVSCNPSTQARDVALLKEKYDVLKIRPVDMFPHTHHIENVALLKLRK